MLKDWKRNKHSNFSARWDKGSTEIHILKTINSDSNKRYYIQGSHSVGGYFDIGKGYARTYSQALKYAKAYMRTH